MVLIELQKFDAEKLMYLNICLQPLTKLTNPTLPKLPSKDDMADLLKSPANISKLIYEVTVEILWNRLTTLIAKETTKEGDELNRQDNAENWFHVFRTLRGRLKYRRSITGPLPPSHVIFFDMQMCTYLLALNFVMPPHQVIATFCDPEVKQEWNVLLDKGENYKGVEDMLPLLAVLWKVVSKKAPQAEAPTKQGGYFARDVFAYFLQDKGPYGADVADKALKTFLANSSAFVSFCGIKIIICCLTIIVPRLCRQMQRATL